MHMCLHTHNIIAIPLSHIYPEEFPSTILMLYCIEFGFLHTKQIESIGKNSNAFIAESCTQLSSLLLQKEKIRVCTMLLYRAQVLSAPQFVHQLVLWGVHVNLQNVYHDLVWFPDSSMNIYISVVTCMGRSKAPPVPLLPLLHEAYCMARSITKVIEG